jgi:hypothetical protein
VLLQKGEFVESQHDGEAYSTFETSSKGIGQRPVIHTPRLKFLHGGVGVGTFGEPVDEAFGVEEDVFYGASVCFSQKALPYHLSMPTV